MVGGRKPSGDRVAAEPAVVEVPSSPTAGRSSAIALSRLISARRTTVPLHRHVIEEQKHRGIAMMTSWFCTSYNVRP